MQRYNIFYQVHKGLREMLYSSANQFHRTRLLPGTGGAGCLRVFAIAPAPPGLGPVNAEFSSHEGLVLHEARIAPPPPPEARP